MVVIVSHNGHVAVLRLHGNMAVSIRQVFATGPNTSLQQFGLMGRRRGSLSQELDMKSWLNAGAEVQLVRIRRSVINNRELMAELGPGQRGPTEALGLVLFTGLNDGIIMFTRAETLYDAISFLQCILVNGVVSDIVGRLSLVDGHMRRKAHS